MSFTDFRYLFSESRILVMQFLSNVSFFLSSLTELATLLYIAYAVHSWWASLKFTRKNRVETGKICELGNKDLPKFKKSCVLKLQSLAVNLIIPNRTIFAKNGIKSPEIVRFLKSWLFQKAKTLQFSKHPYFLNLG